MSMKELMISPNSDSFMKNELDSQVKLLTFISSFSFLIDLIESWDSHFSSI